MKKIEIVHGPSFQKVLESLRDENLIDGYTTLNIHSGFGPHHGSYEKDHIVGEQYHTYILYEGDPERIRGQIAARHAGGKLTLVISDVDCRSID